MEAIHRQDLSVRFDVFTTVPEGFFADTLDGVFDYHVCKADVGLKQTSPFEHDVAATRGAVEAYIAWAPGEAEALGGQLGELGCSAVVCDISPLGLMAATAAGLPSVLVENFTWDWLYEPMVEQDAAFRPLADWMKARYAEAGQRIQARPGCDPAAAIDLVVDPISRRPRRSRGEVRAEFEVGDDDPLVLITTGGITQPLPFLDKLPRRPDVTFVVTGSERTTHEANVWRFHNADRVFLPDLFQAADLVIAKLGYSTLAEVWAAGCPLGYVGRSGFRETAPMQEFAESEMPCAEIAEADFESGAWMERLDELLGLQRGPTKLTNGGEAAARLVMRTLALGQLPRLGPLDARRSPPPPSTSSAPSTF